MTSLSELPQTEKELYNTLSSGIQNSYADVIRKMENALTSLKFASNELGIKVADATDMSGKETLKSVLVVVNNCINDLESSLRNIENVRDGFRYNLT